MVGIPELKVKYSSPASPPAYIDMSITYKFGVDEIGCFITDGNFFKYMPFTLITALFSPTEKIYTWREIQKMFDEQNSQEEIIKSSTRKKRMKRK